MKKLDNFFVMQKFGEEGIEVKDIYKGNNIPLLCKKNGYKFYMSYVSLTEGKNPTIFGFNNPFYKENMFHYLKNKFPDIKILDFKIIIKSQKKRALFVLQCSCGQTFKKTWDTLFRGKYCVCNQCLNKILGKKRIKDKNEFIQMFTQRGYTILQKIDGCTRGSLIEVCDQKGFKGYTSYAKLRDGKKMSVFDTRINKKYYIYNINIYCVQNGIKSRALSFSEKNKWTRQGIVFKCQCGDIFETSIASFQNGKILCDKCSRLLSSYERKVKDFLEDNNIDYIYQYRINSCRDVLPLPFDFFLINEKKLIEVDGEGHFYPRKTKELFEIVKKHDYIKNSYCKKFNIPLLRIEYKDFKTDVYIKKIKQFIKK